MTDRDAGNDVPTIPVPEVRDYERINAELIRLLDEGHPRVRLAGVEGQRFLAAGLAGGWRATVEVAGAAGPELAADLDAPGLTVACSGAAADGAARGLRSGRVVILGEAGDGLAYAQRGGLVLAAQGAGARAGLNQAGGILLILGAVGRLAGERQGGGWLVTEIDQEGPHAGVGARGGRHVRLVPGADPWSGLRSGDGESLKAACRELGEWLPARFQPPNP